MSHVSALTAKSMEFKLDAYENYYNIIVDVIWVFC